MNFHQLEMLWAFGEVKRVHVTESPVPNRLGIMFNIFRRRPWRHFTIVLIDEHRLDSFGPSRYDLATKDGFLRSTLIRARTWLLNLDNCLTYAFKTELKGRRT